MDIIAYILSKNKKLRIFTSYQTILVACVLLIGCQPKQQSLQNDYSMNKTHTNQLIHETSPYLLQHAHNPVNWYPWTEEALAIAKKEDKPILISIGYSSCHWCHVMEKESFESEEIAQIMNEHFVCIKVDREERPDLDQIYMEAIQVMGSHGGWPLNVFLTADKQPFYGGTYFPPEKWKLLLTRIAEAYEGEKKQELIESAEKVTKALAGTEVEKYNLLPDTALCTEEGLDKAFKSIADKSDMYLGGMDKAPKFPMPSIYLFLNRYYEATNNSSALHLTELTLKEMAKGGIYDQIGGGFARYSTDAQWFAPHFEKMLYDNGQLVSLYSEAYQITQNEVYKTVVYETIDWLKREMTNEEGGFYSALDADSEGEEGTFYIWKYDSLKEILSPNDLEVFTKYYNVKKSGNWEHGNNILYKKHSDEEFARKFEGNPTILKEKVKEWKKTLLEVRDKRERPGLDDKVLLAWNALMLKGLVSAYRAFDDQEILDLALKNAEFIEQKMYTDKLYHTYKDGKATLDAYLDDYASLAEAYIQLYQVTFDEKWLIKARELADICLKDFYDEQENMFYFTSAEGEELIVRKKDLFDNVIPASNSIMANNLYFLGLYFPEKEYSKVAEKMLGRVQKIIPMDGAYLSNWGSLYALNTTPTAEIAIVGENAQEIRKEFDKEFLPNVVFAGTNSTSDLPLLQNRTMVNDKTTIYVCFNHACQLPVHSVQEALSLLKK